MQKTSTFKLNKGTPAEVEYKVITEVPENLCEQIGHKRASELLASFGIAHWVQAGFKSALAAKNKPCPEAPKEGETPSVAFRNWTTNKEIRETVEAGKALNIMDFVPAPRGEGKNVVEFKAKWPTATTEKRVAFLRSKELDETLAAADMEEVLPVYLEWLESKDDMGL